MTGHLSRLYPLLYKYDCIFGEYAYKLHFVFASISSFFFQFWVFFFSFNFHMIVIIWHTNEMSIVYIYYKCEWVYKVENLEIQSYTRNKINENNCVYIWQVSSHHVYICWVITNSVINVFWIFFCVTGVHQRFDFD